MEREGWKRMVLRSMPRPAWLSDDAPQGDVVLSSRTRTMRNLRGYRFPHKAPLEELQAVVRAVQSAAERAGLDLEMYRSLTQAERDYFVGSRLVSPDLRWTLPHRALFVDRGRSLSLMVNEEDHLRLQSLSAGWSIRTSDRLHDACLGSLSQHLAFARHPSYGYLSASPFNGGEGRRRSAMFHLIGLAQAKRLPSVLKALAVRGIAVRGLFGESSRAIGAFAQVSLLNGGAEDFSGACEYLIREEREARGALGREILEERAKRALHFAQIQRTVSLADALRVLGWLRWAASADIPGVNFSPRTVDETLTLLDLGLPGAVEANVDRAAFLRSSLGL